MNSGVRISGTGESTSGDPIRGKQGVCAGSNPIKRGVLGRMAGAFI